MLNEACPPVTDVGAHMQAQGNLAEYIGIFVVMLAVLELNGASEGALIEIEGAEAVWRVGTA